MKFNADARYLLEFRLRNLLSMSIRAYLNGSYGDAYNYREQAYAIFHVLESFTSVELRDFNGYFFAALEEYTKAGTATNFSIGDYAVQMCNVQETIHRCNKGGTKL